MKKISFAAILIVCIQLLSFGQSESEPNNSFATADLLPSNTPTTGSLNNPDTVDFHKLHFNTNGTFVLNIEMTNTGSSGSQQFMLSIYNTLRISGNYVGNFFTQYFLISEDDTYSTSFTFCGKAKDSFYLRLRSLAEFDYTIDWVPVNGYASDDLFLGANNTAATASSFSYNILKEASAGYEFWGNTNFDSVDYFISTLPAANYNDVSLTITAQNALCSGPPNKWISYSCFKNGNPVPFATGFVGNNSGVSPGQQVFSSIPLNSMAQGDVLMVKFLTNGTFGYRFKYGLADEFEPDVEDNCCTNNAITIVEGIAKSGNVGAYNYNTEVHIDEYDTYRIILPYDGAFNLIVKARTDECTEWSYVLTGEILDKYGNGLNNSTLISWENYPACGLIQTDTFKFRAFAADTFYLRLNTNNSDYYGKVSYNIRYQRVDSTGSDANESYNGPTSTVLPVSVGEIKKGHVRFTKSTVQVDALDLYRVTLPADGSITVYLKATYRGANSGSNNNSNNRLSLIGPGFTDRTPSNPPFTNLTPDAVYLDTFRVCGLGAGDNIFTWSSNLPYEYEFRYELTDTSSTDNDAEPNNSFAQATVVPGGVTKQGHINYIQNVTTDTYDYYKMIYYNSDSLKIPLQATNTSCEDNKTITFRGYNKNQSQIFSRVKSNVAGGQTVYDTIKVFINAPDTIYFRVEATDAFKYSFSTNPRLPTSTFILVGDTSTCLGTKTYAAINMHNETVTYNWSLPLGGGTLSFVDSVATVTWNTTGNRAVRLFLTNPTGNSQTKTLNVVVNGSAPTQVPVAYNFARTLSTNSLPAGSYAQWFKDNVLIPGATDSTHYATDSGSYNVKFVNQCGQGPVSNTIYFNADVQSQTISFPHVPTITMSPTARAALNATASSGLPIFYQKVSGPGNVVNDTVFVTGAGTIIIKAMQPGDNNFSAAVNKFDTIIVVKGNQVISFDSIPDLIHSPTQYTLVASSSVGLGVSFSIVSGNASVSSGNKLNKTGVGMVTVRASQNGNANYNAVTPLERTFCIGVRTITPITGEINPCLSTYRYNTQKIPGANYTWTLTGGGILTTNKDTAWVQWQTAGTHTLKVKANSPCDPVFSNEPELVISTSGNAPAVVSNMLPADNAIDQQLPLQLSWIPGGNTVNYDLYVWDSALPQPGVPYASNISNISYTLPNNSFTHNKTYKWRVISKNPCQQTAGPIQQFSLIPLPDLAVNEILTPSAANSGQTITVTWKIKNVGPGNTTTNQSWNDAVFLSFDTVPNFTRPPQLHGPSWASTNIPVRPLLLGTRANVTALDSGQSYTNSISYTLPLSYSQPLYVYVITNYGGGYNKPLQVTKINDTARAPQPINVTLSPTPDLRVDTVIAPNVTFSGTPINLTYKVKNYAVITPDVSWVDSVFISQSPLFDRSNSIVLNRAKANGSYYPNAVRATDGYDTILSPNESYVNTLPVVVPNNIFGQWFIYVMANANNGLYEGALANNNVNVTPVQVYLTPTPKLTVSTLNLPITQASTTQTIGANWNIYNDGFRDNWEKNRGHYITIGGCQVPCPPGTPQNSICYGSSVIRDSVVFGSSYWIDRIYMSTDSTGLNLSNAVLLQETTHGTINSGLYLDRDPSYVSCPAVVSGNINVANIINPGSNFPKSASFNIPSNLQPGNYFVYVYTNPTKTVFEYPGTAQIKRSALPVVVNRPDLVVSGVSAPLSISGGQPFTVNYNILNNGAGSVYNHVRKDRIYVSTFPAFDASAQLIDTKTYTDNVPAGATVGYSLSYTFPAATSGQRYFYVHTNYDSAFKETNQANNISASSNPVLVSAASPNDLIVSGIQLADTVITLFSKSLIYTVTNNGTGTAAGTWTDSLYFSCSPVLNSGNSYFAAKKIQTRIIAAGGSYTDTIVFSIPKMSYEVNSCFPQIANTTAFFFIKTNADNKVYEGSNGGNNITGTGSRVLMNPLVDHIVTSVSGADTTTVARPYTVSWTLKNIGENPSLSGIHSYYNEYYDAIYFSPDSVFNSSAVIAGYFKRSDRLNKNQTLSTTKIITTPNIPTGNYYVLANTNYTNKITGEKVLTNNVNLIRDGLGKAKKMHVIQPLLPDLTDSILVSPATVASGQPFTLIRRISNKGAGVSYPGSIKNSLWLSDDFNLSSSDRLLFNKTWIGALQPGQSFDDTITVTIPNYVIEGNYVLIDETNSTGTVFESNHNNNTAFSLLTVFNPPVSDLLVEKVLIPDTVYLGYTIDTAKWVIKNQSENTAIGSSSDGIYLSPNSSFDSAAVLVGIKTKNINMAPLAADTVRLAAFVDKVTEGNYNVFVKTDLLNNIPETDKDNNTGMAASPIYVKVKELPMNVLTPNTLHKIARYYKLVLPDSLLGATIRISLKTNDSSTVRNEMFVASSYIPSPAQFDYRFEIPNYGNQQIVIASVTDTVYYIMYKCASPNPPVQSVTLKAEKLPFAILTVHTNSGGNIGNVTIKINGSLFRDSMVAKLSNANSTIYSSAVYYTNSTTAYATFNLRGKSLGIYDVTLVKTDNSEAVLFNGFSIVNANNGGLNPGGGSNSAPGNGNAPGCDPGAPNGLNSQLVVQLVAPPSVVTSWPFIIQINYSNPTNSDIPAQSRVVYIDSELKLALTAAGVSNGTSSLYLELTEPGGPPGIIRAGGSGTITLYTKSPPNSQARIYPVVTIKLQ